MSVAANFLCYTMLMGCCTFLFWIIRSRDRRKKRKHHIAMQSLLDSAITTAAAAEATYTADVNNETTIEQAIAAATAPLDAAKAQTLADAASFNSALDALSAAALAAKVPGA